MSRLPSNDPTLGDGASCDALKFVIVPRGIDFGGRSLLRRALPSHKNTSSSCCPSECRGSTHRHRF
jgi:hypothetical protein